MKKIILLIPIFLFYATGKSNAQVNPQIILSPGDSLRRNGNIMGAIDEFKKVYKKVPGDEINIYNYACALAITKQNDSCFKYLNLTLQKEIKPDALTDPDFISVRSDQRWNDFENKLIALIEKKTNKHYQDIEYAKQLWEMNALDQAFYSDIELAENKIGRNSTVVLDLWEFKNHLNDQNLKDLEKLIEKKGWPTISQVGGRAAGAAFLVIQHSNTEKQKTYLPVIEKLCEQKEASWESYALMYDRIQVSEKKPQKYGSQVTFNAQTQKWELFPLLDEAKVEEWRKDAGMVPLAEYIAGWGIKFEPKKN
jgi:hypothetical protein